MVLDHWVSQSSDNSYLVEYNPDSEGREIDALLSKDMTCGYDTELDNAVGMSASCSPFQATEIDTWY